MADVRAIRILGVDPGLSRTGWGLIDCNGKDVRVVSKVVIETRSSQSFPARLFLLHEGLDAIIQSYTPQVLSVESAIFAKNTQIALKLGHARGVLVLAAAQRELAISEYSPKEIKVSVTGNGNASKNQVQRMVQSILRLQEIPSPNDIADALAVAICYYHRSPAC